MGETFHGHSNSRSSGYSILENTLTSASRFRTMVTHLTGRHQEGDSMSEFVICINNDSNLASLILGKVYRTLPDTEAEAHNMIRIIDEDKSEPDGYLYPATMFAPIELPEIAKRVLMAVGD